MKSRNASCLAQLILMKHSFYNNAQKQPFVRILQETEQNINKNEIAFKSLFRSCIKISIQRQKYFNSNSGCSINIKM